MKMSPSSLFLFTSSFIIFTGCCLAQQFVDPLLGSCDQLSAGYLLRCIGPLLQYTRYNIHPKIGSVVNNSSSSPSKFGDQICLLYNEYKFCAPVQLRQRCADLVSSVESVYDYVCSPEIFTNFSKNADCLVRVDSSDAQVSLCEQNTTTTLRRIASVASLNMSERMHMQCDAVQQYFYCIMNKYLDACGQDAWDLKVAITKRSTAVQLANCTFETKPRPEDLSKPICAANGSCTCRPGFVLTNDICTDIDECAEKVDVCSQHCENRPGSFVCLCDDRYYNSSNDGRKCVRKDKDSPPYIFFAHGQSIWNITLDGKHFQLKRAALQKTAMIDIDAKERMLYYIDIAANKLERIRFEGAFPQTLQTYDLEGSEGLAVDWIGRKLYSAKSSNLYVQELDGRYRKSLYNGVFKLPRAVVAHSLRGYVFASDWGSQAFIGKMKMDGSGFKQIITTGLTWPNGLAIDIYAEKLYWADAFADVIECSDFDGNHRRAVLQDANTVPHPFGLAIMDDDLYWTDWTYRGILKASKFNGENVTVVAQTALLPYGLKIYYPGVQPEGRNPCGSSNGNCDHMCLLSPANENSTSGPLNFACVCAEGYQLGADGKTCKPRCGQNQIVCSGADAKCISKKYWCDGVVQCSDKSDEENCPPRICLPNQFQCHNNKTCILETKLCDNTKNCDDASDEIYCL